MKAIDIKKRAGRERRQTRGQGAHALTSSLLSLPVRASKTKFTIPDGKSQVIDTRDGLSGPQVRKLSPLRLYHHGHVLANGTARAVH